MTSLHPSIRPLNPLMKVAYDCSPSATMHQQDQRDCEIVHSPKVKSFAVPVH
jgi:hypothetical protein